ncbi:MAG: DUF2997 domain-containing protein [Proteobacteria bacterium]|nr:DUF2997 domain-containing protein [Verrucomicrobiota bacterium]NBU11631.1 DUF2997 domain-containing protein [Pseudomonadota bacterium]
MKPTIEIIVSPTGEFTIEGVGFKGAGCEKATKFLEAALGKVEQRRKKPEFHQHAVSKQQQQLGQ